MATSTDSRKKPPSINSLLTGGPGHVFTETVGKLTVKPQEQLRMSLGVFSNSEPPRGFLVEIYSDAESDNAVVAQVMPVGSERRYELVLHVANYGSKPARAKVWQMGKY